ncbi:MAG TPA: NADP-dependent phosphogluconate dehydrogenase [Erysipelothrix sp.]|nr:NADP-dependent phosphogluconate dehydrogenase [Erysipelothrix sp.]
MKNDIGVMGLAVMGRNLALNIADHDYKVSLFNRTYSVGEKVMEETPHDNFTLYKELEDFVNSLSAPRKIIIMVKAGRPVDLVIDSLIPLLDEGDIIMDGGNSFFEDTIRRHKALSEKGLRYLGVGISGGEEGARFGPSIMPGGDKEAYSHVEDILVDISAKAYGEACTTYIGDNGAGHFVKTIHNGIEYADMQLIAESYALLKHVGKLSNKELAETFTEWNKGELDSYLIEITSQIFNVKDPDSDNDLIDVILDKAEQKGTGKWTADEALNTGTDASLLASAVFARFMSANKGERVVASTKLDFSGDVTLVDDKLEFVEKVRQALYASKIIAYAQGFDLMKNAAKEYGWELNYGEIAKIWREGCIIRAKFLDKITEAYNKDKDLDNLMLDENFKDSIQKYQTTLREVSSIAIQNGISAPAFLNAISYYDSYRTAHSSANLIQAQRDFFGAHTFERVDKEGSFHYEWGNEDA